MVKTRVKLFFEMPYDMASPSMLNRDLGIDRLIRRGSEYSFVRDFTLIDTPDNRLVRAGVLLTKRSIGGRKDWYLDAPTWGPWLPTKKIIHAEEPDDIPTEFRNLVRPFHRETALDECAQIHQVRNEYLIRDADGNRLAKLRDNRFQVKRGHTVTTQVREVTLWVESLNQNQRDYIVASLEAVGGRSVDALAKFVDHLGAPALGTTDLPEPNEWRKDMKVREYVSWLFSVRLRELIQADLAVRSGSTSDASAVILQLQNLSNDIRGLSGILDPQWAEGFRAMLRAITDRAPGPVDIDQLGEYYFVALDRLVNAVSSPRIQDDVNDDAGSVMNIELEKAVAAVIELGDAMRPISLDKRWGTLEHTVSRALDMTRLTKPLMGKLSKKLEKNLSKLSALLGRTLHVQAEPSAEEIAELTPQAAYELGKSFQQRKDAVRIARSEFVEQWPQRAEKLREVNVG